MKKTTQNLTVQSEHIYGWIYYSPIERIARSIASTDVDGRKTKIATYTFCKNKTQKESEHKEQLRKTAQAHDHEHYFKASP